MVTLAASKWIVIAAVLATVGFGCTVHVVKEGGEVTDVYSKEQAEKTRSVAAGFVEEVKDKLNLDDSSVRDIRQKTSACTILYGHKQHDSQHEQYKPEQNQQYDAYPFEYRKNNQQLSPACLSRSINSPCRRQDHIPPSVMTLMFFFI